MRGQRDPVGTAIPLDSLNGASRLPFWAVCPGWTAGIPSEYPL